jgi:hypothetical protein
MTSEKVSIDRPTTTTPKTLDKENDDEAFDQPTSSSD